MRYRGLGTANAFANSSEPGARMASNSASACLRVSPRTPAGLTAEKIGSVQVPHLCNSAKSVARTFPHKPCVQAVYLLSSVQQAARCRGEGMCRNSIDNKLLCDETTGA